MDLQPWEEYAQQVENGEIVVGKYVRLAVERFRRDLERQNTEDFPYYFDETKAAVVCQWFPA